MTPEEEMQRGHNAARILNDEMYKESFEAVRERLNALLDQIDIDTEKERRVLYMKRGLAAARRHLESVMQSGKMAAQQIEQDKKSLAERIRERL